MKEELIGKICKVYVSSLSGKVCGENDYGKEYAVSDKPIIYTAEIKSIDQIGESTFLRIIDRTGVTVRINIKYVIQITEVDDGGNY